MIRINLTGTPKKKAAKAAARAAGPSNAMPLVHGLILVGALVGGYYWYSTQNAKSTELTEQIQAKDQELKALAVVIKQNEIHETRKGDLQKRIDVIEKLRTGQANPLLILDKLADAIDRTQFVWLSSLNQNNALVTMAGSATSVDVLADFVGNLQATGYFRNVNWQNFGENRGSIAFNLTCEFAPPTVPAPPKPSAAKGAN